jgi:adenylate kinase family enzyme
MLAVRRPADVSMKPRIHLIGGPGSGKSYAAARLSSQFDVPAYALDDLFWDNTASGYEVRAEPAARDRQLASLVERDGWIIEGVYYGWVAPSFAAADIIIAMTPSISVRHWRVIKRFVLRKAGRVPSPNTNESLASLWRLLRWSQTFNAQHLGEARRAVTTLGRSWVECRTIEDVLAATCYLERN